MAKVDLIAALPAEDKELFKKYVLSTSKVDEEEFIGVENYLDYWSKSKGPLYKMLGCQFRVKFPIDIEKDNQIIREELRGYFNQSDLCWIFMEAVRDIRYHYKVERNSIDPDFDYNMWSKAEDWCHSNITLNGVVSNEVHDNLTLKLPGKKKTLRLQAKGKLMRGLQKLASFLAEGLENTFNQSFARKLLNKFESFRLNHSLIFNDKSIKGDLILSIHPMDFVTMSDNSLNWQSCMSWVHNGCYHLGTVEMMNSNKVVCAYLESKTPYDIKIKENNIGTWNNKRYRVLLYVTKDIIMSGKSYPYECTPLAKEAISCMRKLAEKNFGWTYKYGIEKYYDMKHIGTQDAFDNNRMWRHNHKDNKKPSRWCGSEGFKHNILFDTKAMYNDMANDHCYNYWCVRNKVDRTKIISVSGKAPCLCCGDEIPKLDDDSWEYNERFGNCSNTICPSCHSIGECEECGDYVGSKQLKKIFAVNHYNSEFSIMTCKDCYENSHVCPCCGKLTFHREFLYIGKDTPTNWYEVEAIRRLYYESKLEPYLEYADPARYKSVVNYFKENKDNYLRIIICNNCMRELERYEISYLEPGCNPNYSWKRTSINFITFDPHKLDEVGLSILKNTDAIKPKWEECDKENSQIIEPLFEKLKKL